jgi:predicted RNA binding protein YcfA (HicA-like mRNA interferase family)
LPGITASEAETLLFRAGFVLLRSEGSHRIYQKEITLIVVTFHAGKVLHPKIVKQFFNAIAKFAS